MLHKVFENVKNIIVVTYRETYGKRVCTGTKKKWKRSQTIGKVSEHMFRTRLCLVAKVIKGYNQIKNYIATL